MHYPILCRAVPAPIERSLAALGPEDTLLFAVMHRETALLILRLGKLPCLGDLHTDPAWRPLGDPEPILTRLHKPMREPFRGRIGDATSLTFTPRTLPVFGSCGHRLARGAQRYEARDLVVVVVSLDQLQRSGLPFVFSDRSAIREDANVTTTVHLAGIPWPRIRSSEFGANVPLDERARYHAEVLVWGNLPLDAILGFALANQSAVDALQADAAALNTRFMAWMQPSFFFDEIPGWNSRSTAA